MLKTRSQLIVGALFASGVLSNCYGSMRASGSGIRDFPPSALEMAVARNRGIQPRTWETTARRAAKTAKKTAAEKAAVASGKREEVEKAERDEKTAKNNRGKARETADTLIAKMVAARAEARRKAKALAAAELAVRQAEPSKKEEAFKLAIAARRAARFAAEQAEQARKAANIAEKIWDAIDERLMEFSMDVRRKSVQAIRAAGEAEAAAKEAKAKEELAIMAEIMDRQKEQS
jgi:colicin import membrane protein